MAARPICEPVGLPIGTVALVDRVRIAADAPPVARLLHFHDVAEIVLFGDVRGRFLCDGTSFAITPGSAVFAPSMTYHDFHLEDGAKDWTLIQIDPFVFERAGGGIAVPARPFRVVPDASAQARLALLTDWAGRNRRRRSGRSVDRTDCRDSADLDGPPAGGGG